MVIGKSGSGKSSSLRNFEPGEVGVFSCADKPLPFRKKLDVATRHDYADICASLQANKRYAYVVDDSTYLMQFEMFARADEKGYGKFTDIAVSFERLLEYARLTSPDTIVYFLHHPEFADDGSAKPQTVGKMLNNQLCVEGLFPIVIEAVAKDGKYQFLTENNGFNLAKAPIDFETGERMLPAVMDNDLKAVDTAIRKFYGMASLKNAREDEE